MILIAHRMPATAAGCAELVDHGANVFEVDLQLSGPDVVISHALPLIRHIPYLRHDGWKFSWSLIGAPLRSALDRLPAGTQLMLDLKNDRGPDAARLVDALLALALDPARVVISSKNWPMLARLAAAGFQTWRSVDTRASLRSLLAAQDHNGSYAVTVRHTFLDPETVAALKPFGVIIAWTVNDVGRALTLAAIGVEGLTSDNSAVFRALT
jgi:hypothetical protein